MLPSRLGSIVRRVRNAIIGEPPPAAPLPPKLEDDLAAVGLGLAEMVVRFRCEATLFPDIDDTTVESLRGRQPERVTALMADADAIVDHRFDLLGSGPYTPIDPSRPVGADDYRPIDWFLDPVRNLRFPTDVPARQWRYYEMRPENADIKYPWELGRCQHWVTLGQAWRFTGDERYVVEFARQFDDFREANPPGIGVNWACAMDVAIRSVSLATTLGLIRRAKVLDDRWWGAALTALFDHGAEVQATLENTYEVTTNHYAANIAGLYYATSPLTFLPTAASWKRFARKELEREIFKQTDDDGVDFESSVPYHRLVTEFFLAAARQGAFNGEPFSSAYAVRLEKMIAVIRDLTRPDGLMPLVGDMDDGRFLVLTDYGRRDHRDGRHLLAAASAHFGDDRWLAGTGEAGEWEAAFYGRTPGETIPEAPSCASRLYATAGWGIVRSPTAFALMTNGPVGTEGFGNHKHNDNLSFEYCFGDTPVIVDPGSYVYTSDFEARNRFRSALCHNGVVIDDVEPDEIRPGSEWLFRAFAKGRSTQEPLRHDEEGVVVVGSFERHGGEEGWGVRRQIRLRPDGGLLVEDEIITDGERPLTWRFYCDPSVSVTKGEGEWRLDTGESSLSLVADPPLETACEEGWYSPSYGVRQTCPVIRFVGKSSNGSTLFASFLFIPRT